MDAVTETKDPKYLNSKMDFAIYCKTCGHYGEWHAECNGGETFGCEKPDCNCREFVTLVIDGYVQYDLEVDEIVANNVDKRHLVRKTSEVLKK